MQILRIINRNLNNRLITKLLLIINLYIYNLSLLILLNHYLSHFGCLNMIEVPSISDACAQVFISLIRNKILIKVMHSIKVCCKVRVVVTIIRTKHQVLLLAPTDKIELPACLVIHNQPQLSVQ